MKKSIATAALLLSSALAVGALAPSAASARALKPGSYDVGGMENVCLVPGGRWYSETVQGSSGNWFAGPTGKYSTLIFGHYASGAGSDSIVVGKGVANWMEWNTADGKQVFLYGLKVTPTPGKCTPPASQPPRSGHPDPLD